MILLCILIQLVFFLLMTEAKPLRAVLVTASATGRILPNNFARFRECANILQVLLVRYCRRPNGWRSNCRVDNEDEKNTVEDDAGRTIEGETIGLKEDGGNSAENLSRAGIT
ncbi:MAG: hypothetical protein H6Q76_2644 [Firmicutes bacterium]|nr:hypothetical protein [Bacillota bacterium]